MNNTIMIDVGGWVGVALLLIAYALVSMRRLEGDSTIYQLLNVAGSILLIINSFFYGAFPSVASISCGSLLLCPLCFGNNIAVEKIASDIALHQLSRYPLKISMLYQNTK